jgi:hypothetical protein
MLFISWDLMPLARKGLLVLVIVGDGKVLFSCKSGHGIDHSGMMPSRDLTLHRIPLLANRIQLTQDAWRHPQPVPAL